MAVIITGDERDGEVFLLACHELQLGVVGIAGALDESVQQVGVAL